jgi:hypothetical protein
MRASRAPEEDGGGGVDTTEQVLNTAPLVAWPDRSAWRRPVDPSQLEVKD